MSHPSVPTEKSDESVSPPDESAPPPPPPDTAPTPEEEEQRKREAAAELIRWRAAYDKFVARGKQRVDMMRAAALAGGGALTEKDRKIGLRQSIFDVEYRHCDEDWHRSPTGLSVKTLWRGKRLYDNDTSGYRTTALPAKGEFYIWECVREVSPERQDDDNEELHVSDICFHLYLRAHTGIGPVPRLRTLLVQSPEANGEMDFYRYMGTKNLSGTGVALGERLGGTDDYYAFLGAANANAPIFMIIDGGHQLGISGISSVIVGDPFSITYVFTPRAQGLGGGSTSGSSSSSSSSSSS